MPILLSSEFAPTFTRRACRDRCGPISATVICASTINQKQLPQPVSSHPFSEISMDFINGLPKSEGKDSILVVVDRLTKYGYFMGLSHLHSITQVGRVFMDNIY